VLNPPASGGIIISNIANASAPLLNITTISGEVLSFTAAKSAQPSGPIWLEFQVAIINSATNIGAITALWH
jgi:hypothetical protein